MIEMPAQVVAIRVRLCPECIDKAPDPCAWCEHKKWGAYVAVGCPDSPFIIRAGHVLRGVRGCCSQAPKTRLGTMISKIATPIARALGLSCIDRKTGQLKSDSGCAKMIKRLDAGMSIKQATELRFQGK